MPNRETNSLIASSSLLDQIFLQLVSPQKTNHDEDSESTVGDIYMKSQIGCDGSCKMVWNATYLSLSPSTCSRGGFAGLCAGRSGFCTSGFGTSAISIDSRLLLIFFRVFSVLD